MQVLVGVQVRVVVVLLADVLVSCFSVGLLLCSSGLKTVEEVQTSCILNTTYDLTYVTVVGALT